METTKYNQELNGMSPRAKKAYFANLATQMASKLNRHILLKKELMAEVDHLNLDPRDIYRYLIHTNFRHSFGKYDLKLIAQQENLRVPTPAPKPAVTPADVSSVVKLKTQDTSEDITYVPERDPLYVRWGHHNDVTKILGSKMFFPIYVAGPSGNGKTMMVTQAAAQQKVKFIRVQLTPETDEDDLIGGFRLVDGNTVFCKGPVIRAMEEGSVLLLDEIDRATNKIMCLQSILEGKSVLIKKTGETVFPQPGFQIVATANTNGRGSEDGRYTAASIIDDAFLERFPITMNQLWPSARKETNVLVKHMEKFDCADKEFAEKLVTWANIIRETFQEGAVDDEISTRRLCHIVQTFSIFHNRMDAIRLTINRFHEDSREAFLDLYSKVDEGAIKPQHADTDDFSQAMSNGSTINC